MTTWKWYPSPPEMLHAELDTGQSYLYECVGNVPARDGEEGDLIRVFCPDSSHASRRKDVIEELKEKHGRYAESIHEAREMEDFTETYKGVTT